jgi:DNA-directed RNA polymerase subunit alpha
MSHSSIHLPSKLKVVREDGPVGVYEIEGLSPGYGFTLGNSLRRIVLSSMPGAAITALKIDGAAHEFSTLEGVREDVLTIILNLKKVRFQLIGDEPQTATLSVKSGVAYARDFKTSGQLEVLSGDQYIGEVTGKGKGLTIEVTVERGMGFVTRGLLKKEKVDIGMIFVDALFSPIRTASYEVENMRVGDRTDFNRLRMTIETDGTITAREAFESSVKIMIDQLAAVLDLKMEKPAPIVISEISQNFSEEAISSDDTAGEDARSDMTDVLKTRMDSLQLSTRTMNALAGGGIRTLGGLIQKNETDLLALDGFGEKSLEEVKELLEGFGLALK